MAGRESEEKVNLESILVFDFLLCVLISMDWRYILMEVNVCLEVEKSEVTESSF